SSLMKAGLLPSLLAEGARVLVVDLTHGQTGAKIDPYLALTKSLQDQYRDHLSNDRASSDRLYRKLSTSTRGLCEEVQSMLQLGPGRIILCLDQLEYLVPMHGAPLEADGAVEKFSTAVKRSVDDGSVLL